MLAVSFSTPIRRRRLHGPQTPERIISWQFNTGLDLLFILMIELMNKTHIYIHI